MNGKVAHEPCCLRLIPSKLFYSPNSHLTYNGMAEEGLAWMASVDGTLWSPVVWGLGGQSWGDKSSA